MLFLANCSIKAVLHDMESLAMLIPLPCSMT